MWLIAVELLDPIDWSRQYGPEAADDPDVVRECHEQLVGTMQEALDVLAAERRLPIVG